MPPVNHGPRVQVLTEDMTENLKPIENIAVIGLGALGIMYGDFFVQALGTDKVTFLADAVRTARYRTTEVTCNGHICPFRYETPAEYKAAQCWADLVIFAVKGGALKDALRTADPVIGPETVVLSVLNGITSEDIIEKHLQGRGVVIRSVAQAMDALREGRHVRLSSIGELRIGIDKETPDKRTALSRLEQLFNETGLPYKTESDIVRRLYSKWMLNCGVNQTVAVVKGTFADVQKPGAARDMMKAAMREVIAVANKNGVNLTEDDLNEYVAIIDTLMPDGMPSMRQDTLAKRPTEVDLFAGTVIEKAKAAGIEVPVNTALYEKIKAIEAAY